jgi:hypothetical protein
MSATASTAAKYASPLENRHDLLPFLPDDKGRLNKSLIAQPISSWPRQPPSTPLSALVLPVLFLVFNRPQQTSRVFDVIRQARPERLYVAADGPRRLPEEARKCDEVRRIVAQVDWPCEVKTLLRSKNLGCKQAVSDAITWFFDHEPEGIILEDDCLPSLSFFWFCQELIARFREDERIWQICGTSRLEHNCYHKREASYLFSRYGPIWGWASWRRAWQHFDPHLTDWSCMRRPHLLNSVCKTRAERRFLRDLGNKLHRRQIDTWDFQWEFTKVYQSGLSVVPSINMVVNIGFGPDATHTLEPDPWAPARKADLWPPITHPRYVVPNEAHDLRYLNSVLLGSQRERARRAFRGLLNWGFSLCVDKLMQLK